MTQKQENFLNMTKGVVFHFEKYGSAYANEALVKEAFAVVLALSVKFDDFSTKQAIKTEGFTSRKDSLYEQMVEGAFKLSRKMALYARKAEDLALLNMVDHSRTSLEKGTEAETYHRCKVVVEQAQLNVDKVAPYKVDQALIDELVALMDSYAKAPAEKKLVNTERQYATANLNELIGALRTAFEDLDDAVFTQIEDQEEFVQNYRLLRKIGQRGVGKTTHKETVA